MNSVVLIPSFTTTTSHQLIHIRINVILYMICSQYITTMKFPIFPIYTKEEHAQNCWVNIFVANYFLLSSKHHQYLQKIISFLSLELSLIQHVIAL